MPSPNFLFVIADQLTAGYLGCYGHPHISTPHIDALAARGVRFDRFHCSSAVCMANRATLMTGRMPTLHKVRHNGIPLSRDATTFTDILSAGGYHTAHIGKGHLQNVTGTPAMNPHPIDIAEGTPPPADLREATKRSAPPGAYDLELGDKWETLVDCSADPYYGFQEVRLSLRHADRVRGHYEAWLAERGETVDHLRGPENALPHDSVCPQAWRTAIPEELYPTAYIADEACAYLKRHEPDAEDTRPFFLSVSFPDPHHPFTPPGRYWNMYDPAEMALPASFHFNHDDAPPHVRWLHQQLSKNTRATNGPAPFAATEQETREAIALTCGMISMIDDAIGRIVAQLEKSGLSENTVIVFTSDHGDYLGQHGLLLKGAIHYQNLIRVPMIWMDPEAAAHAPQSAILSSTLDLPRTILDRADLVPFNGMQGESLIRDVSGSAPRRDMVLIEGDSQRTYLGFESPPRFRSVVTDRHRCTVYRGVSWGEIYDLENDPDEARNLWGDPEAIELKTEMLERLVQLQMELADDSPHFSSQA